MNLYNSTFTGCDFAQEMVAAASGAPGSDCFCTAAALFERLGDGGPAGQPGAG